MLDELMGWAPVFEWGARQGLLGTRAGDGLLPNVILRILFARVEKDPWLQGCAGFPLKSGFLLACQIDLDISSFKIHLATGSDWLPLDAFFEGRFQEWQEHQNARNFSRDMVIALIHLHTDQWLFAGVYRVLGFHQKPEGWFKYDTELLPDQEELVGRLIVSHKRSARAAYLIGKPDGGPFLVSELRAQPMTVADFPGYSSVSVPYSRLRIITGQNLSTWRGALSNMKGVYLITDKATGKLYVGSATGDAGLWQRWCNYARDGHGGNKELKAVLKDQGADYARNFHFSLLEVADSRSSDEYVLTRESFWKDVLASREFGYNSN